LAAKQGWSGPITDLVALLPGFEGYVIVDTHGAVFSASPDTLVGMQSYQRGDAAIVIGQPDFDVVKVGYAAHIAVGGGYTTRVKLVNPSSGPQQLQLTLNGTTVQRTVSGYGRLDESLGQMFNISAENLTTGSLKVQAAGGVAGYVEIAAFDGLVRTTTAISDEAEARLLFSHVAEGAGYFTGLALLNAEDTPASVTIEVHSASGATLASKLVTLQPGGRLVGLLKELFPTLENQLGGFVRVFSSQPIHGLQIFGSADQRAGKFLTNIPAGTF
jgi:hypothetical protein